MTTTKIVIYINIVMCKNIHFGSKAIVVFPRQWCMSMLGVGRVPIFKQRFPSTPPLHHTLSGWSVASWDL